MRPHFLHLLIVVFVGSQLSGCAALRGRDRGKKSKPASPPVPVLVGTITLVNEEERFVLIDSGMNPGPQPGAVLKSRANGVESGELKSGAIRKRPFAVADIVKGTPRTGDEVFQQPP